MSILEELLEKYPDAPWDFARLSDNPNITMYLLEKYPEKPWNWWGISRNPNITMEIIEKHPEKPWNWNGISSNPNLTMEFIEKNINKISFSSLSQNEFTLENKKIKKKESYILLEKERSFHELMNLYVVKKYM